MSKEGHTIKVVPAIIPTSRNDLVHHLVRVKGKVERVQIDVMDGKLSPEPSWPYSSEEGRNDLHTFIEEGLPYWEDINYEIDMIVEEPENYMGEWIDAGVASLIVHVDSTDRFNDIIETCRSADVLCGVAFLPSHDIEMYRDEIKQADFIQLMGSDTIGFHGVELDEAVYEKIKVLKSMFPEKTISVDIGVDETTAPLLRKAGVDVLVSGSYIFGCDDIEEGIFILKGKA